MKNMLMRILKLFPIGMKNFCLFLKRKYEIEDFLFVLAIIFIVFFKMRWEGLTLLLISYTNKLYFEWLERVSREEIRAVLTEGIRKQKGEDVEV